MNCPKCGSPYIHTQMVKKKTSGIWIGATLIGISVSLILTVFVGVPVALIILVVCLAVIPKEEPVQVCQSCGNWWKVKK